MLYILEVQRYCGNDYIEQPEWIGKTEHVGYMNKIFISKQQACDYYDNFNPHMRSLNTYNNWISDWDPETHLIYIVREHFYEYLKIPSFDE